MKLLNSLPYYSPNIGGPFDTTAFIALTGGTRRLGGSPSASSMPIIPRLQISTFESYPYFWISSYEYNNILVLEPSKLEFLRLLFCIASLIITNK